MKILFVLSSLYSGGGVETVTVRLIRYFSELPDTTVSVAVGFSARPDDIRLPDNVQLTYFNEQRYRQVIWRLVGFLRREKPDIVYAATLQVGISVAVAKFISGNRVIVVGGEHAHLPAYRNLPDARDARYYRKLTVFARVFYRFLNKVVFVSEGTRRDNSRFYHLPLDKSLTIPNSIPLVEIQRMAAMEPEHVWFNTRETPLVMALGRLASEKRFDWLIRAFVRVAAESSTRLVIFGSGPEKAALEGLVRSLGLENRISLPGLEQNPFRYLSRADVFVMSSAFECCPSVMLEALACGTPIVSTDCPVGPREIITDGIDGLLVPLDSLDAMAGAILRVINDRELSARLSANARRRAEDYDIAYIGRQYEKLFQELLVK